MEICFTKWKFSLKFGILVCIWIFWSYFEWKWNTSPLNRSYLAYFLFLNAMKKHCFWKRAGEEKEYKTVQPLRLRKLEHICIWNKTREEKKMKSVTNSIHKYKMSLNLVANYVNWENPCSLQFVQACRVT